MRPNGSGRHLERLSSDAASTSVVRRPVRRRRRGRRDRGRHRRRPSRAPRSSACPTPRSTKPRSASAPRSATATRTGPASWSPWRCPRPPCPRAAPATTSPSPAPSSPPPTACHRELLTGMALIGELALDGRIRPVRGVLPGLLAARRAGLRRAVVPDVGAARGRPGRRPGCARRRHPAGRPVLAPRRVRPAPTARRTPAAPVAAADVPDLADVLGQPEARWALEVAAAGGHHLLLTGPPGTGKTMLARRLPGLLPAAHRGAGAGGHRRPFDRRPAVAGRAAGHHAAVRRAASLDLGARA